MTKYSVPDDHWSEDEDGEDGEGDDSLSVEVTRHVIAVDDHRDATGYEYGIEWLFTVEQGTVTGWYKGHYLEGRTQSDPMQSPTWADIPASVRVAVAGEFGTTITEIDVDEPEFYGPSTADDEPTECELCGAATDDPVLSSDSHPAGPNLLICEECSVVATDGGRDKSTDGTERSTVNGRSVIDTRRLRRLSRRCCSRLRQYRKSIRRRRGHETSLRPPLRARLTRALGRMSIAVPPAGFGPDRGARTGHSIQSQLTSFSFHSSTDEAINPRLPVTFSIDDFRTNCSVYTDTERDGERSQ